MLCLLDDGDFTASVDVPWAERHRVFVLSVDWDAFASNHISIRHK